MPSRTDAPNRRSRRLPAAGVALALAGLPAAALGADGASHGTLIALSGEAGSPLTGQAPDRFGDLRLVAPADRLVATAPAGGGTGGLFATQPARGASTAQTGSGNRLTGTRGDLSMLLADQRGERNAIQSWQAGTANAATLDQTGSGNAILGVQGGSRNTATVSQTGLHQVAGYAQSGTGSVLTIRQH